MNTDTQIATLSEAHSWTDPQPSVGDRIVKVGFEAEPPTADAESEERELLLGLRAGSARALERIVAMHRARIYSFAFRFTHNHHDAEEVVQETFLRAYRGGPRFRGDSSLGTWLRVIATNLARNRYW